MPTEKKRPRRVADLLHRAIADTLRRSVNDPRLTQVSIVSVDVSDDLRNAKIFYVLHDVALLADVKVALNKATAFIRHEVAEQIELRYVPKLSFVYDETLERAHKINHLLDEVLPSDDSDDDNPGN